MPGRTSYDGLCDRDLLARTADGDSEAFGEVVRRHRDRLWAVALRTMGDPEEAADALQDALVSALRAAARTGGDGGPGYRGEAAVTTWLHRVVVNACIDRMRRRAVRPTVPLPEREAALPSAPDEIGARETSLVVTEAMRALSDQQRLALVLVDMQGWSVEDAAQVLGVAPGTVKSRCSRGRARLLPLLRDLRVPSADVAGNRATSRGVPSAGDEPAGEGPAPGPARADGMQGGEQRHDR